MKTSFIVLAVCAELTLSGCADTTPQKDIRAIDKIAAYPNHAENRQRLFALKQGFSEAEVKVRATDVCSGYIYGAAKYGSPYTGAKVRAKFTHTLEDNSAIEIGITGIEDAEAKKNLDRVIRNGYRDYLKAPY